MMPLFGDTDRFAIEYELDEDHGSAWLFGRFCYICGGTRVGAFDLGTSLRDVLFQLDEIAKGAGRRRNPELFKLPTVALFNLLDSAMFGNDPDGGPKETFQRADDEKWYWHKALPSVDIFDHWAGYLVESDRGSRMIVGRDPYASVQELLLAPGEFDLVLSVARASLNELYEREQGQ